MCRGKVFEMSDGYSIVYDPYALNISALQAAIDNGEVVNSSDNICGEHSKRRGFSSRDVTATCRAGGGKVRSCRRLC